MKLDDLIALVRRSRAARQPEAGLTPDDVEEIFTRSVGLISGAEAESAAAPARPHRRLTWRTAHLPAAAGIIAVTAAVLIALLVPPGGPAGHGTHQARGSTTTTRPPNTTTPEPAPVCPPTAPDSPVVGYMSLQYGDADSPNWLAAADLPSGHVLWRHVLPDDLQADAMAVSPDGRTLWVAAGRYEKSVELFPVDTLTGDLGRPISIGQLGPLSRGLAISPNGRWALVAQAGAVVIGNEAIGSTVTLVDLATRTAEPPIEVGSGPISVAFSGDSRRAYVSVSTAWYSPRPLRAGLVEIDVATRRVTRRLATPSTSLPGAAALSPVGNLALVGNLQVDLGAPKPYIYVANLRTGHLEPPIHLSGSPDGTSSIAFDCTGSVAFADTESGGMVRIDMRTRLASSVSGPHFDSFGLDGVARSPDGRHLWAMTSFSTGCPNACGSESQLLPLDPTSNAAGAPVSFPWYSELFAVGPVVVG